MLECAEITPTGVEQYQLPLEPVTASRLHADRSNQSLVVSYQTRTVQFAEQPAAFSIKCSFAGPINYVVEGRRVEVREDRYLLVNHQQPYSSYVANSQKVQALSVFFGRPLVTDVLSSLTRTPEECLQKPQEEDNRSFLSHLQPHNPRLLTYLSAVRKASLAGPVDRGWLLEQFHAMVSILVHEDEALRKQIQALPLARSSTRREIYRRVATARDYLESNLSLPLSLQELSEVATMAPHHFLRSFKSVTGTTPHRFLMDRRLDRAHRLLKSQDLTVMQAAEAVGFDSWENFSRQFRKRFSTPPGAVRRAA